MRLTGIVLSIIAVIGIIFAVVWITSIFPGYKEIPADFSRTDEFEGSYTVADPFLDQIMASPAVQMLAQSPSTLALLAEPQVQEFLSGLRLLTLLSDPALLQSLMANLGVLQQAMDPATQQLLSNPEVQQLIANPEATQLLTDPQVLAILADPATALLSTDPTVLQILANPIIQQLIANPTLLQGLADPAIQQLMANPTALQLLLNPAAQGILGNPSVPRLLADTTMQKLLSDPASLQLVTDPRTMRLLSDPLALPVIKIPVLIHRERVATGTDGSKISINEQVTTYIAGTDQELEGFPATNLGLVVDRGDKIYLEGTDGGRTNGLAFPFGVKKDVVYSTWVSAARQPLDTSYVSTKHVGGLEVYVLKIDVKDLSMPAAESDPGPLVVDSNITILVEPNSGRVVDVEDHATTVSLISDIGRKSMVFISDIEYTQETVDIQIEAAKGDARDLLFYGTSLPRLTIGLGVLLIALGAFAFLLLKWTKAVARDYDGD
jgi:hypothetical protein